MKKRFLHWKRVAFAVLFILLLSSLGLTNAMAQTFTMGNLNYSLNDDGASVTVTGHVDGSSATGELVIPESIELYGTTYPVTVIGESAFYNCSGLTGSLVIPNSVITIGSSAFRSCSGFTELMLGNAVQHIYDYSFYYCSGFTGTLTIPESVTSIDYYAFRYCNGFSSLNYNAINCSYINDNWINNTSFTTLNIGESVQTIPSYFLYNKTSFTGELIIPESVTYIGNYAFNGCTGFTESLIIGNSVTSIGSNAFYGCTGFTESLTIGNSVTSIGSNAFYGCTGFTGSLNIPDNVTSIGASAFSGCTGFSESLNIGNSVTSIGNYAFNGCNGFTGTLTIGNSVTTIGENAFDGCTGFTGSLTIPNSVSSIGANAFSGCTGFSDTFTLGNSVTQIGNTAFFGACQGFTSFDVKPEAPPTLGNNVFVSANYGMPVQVPCGTLEAYQNASGWSVFTNIQEPDPCIWEITATANPVEAGIVNGTGSYEQGQTCMLVAVPNEGYEFLSWTEDDQVVSGDAEYSFVATSHRNLVANFELEGLCHIVFDLHDSYGDGWNGNKLVVSANDGTYEELTITSGNTAIYILPILDGSHVTLSWIAGNYIDECSFTVKYASNGYPIYQGTNLNETVYVFDLNCEDEYLPKLITAVAEPTEGGVVSGAGEYSWNEICTLTAIANEGYTFMYWTEENEIVSSDTTYTFIVAGSSELVAHFALPFTVTVATDPEEAGTVDGEGMFDYGTNCTVTATANEGFVFANWTQNGEVVSMEAEYTFTVGGDAEMVAHFVAEGNIVFADANVKSICVNHWDTDGDGELSYLEASRVTSLNNYFQGNTEITSFNELQYFIGLSSITGGYYSYSYHGDFYNCTGLTSIALPQSVISIGEYAFANCTGLTKVYYMGGITQWCHITFGNETSNPLCYAHNLYIDNTLVNNLYIPENVREIKDYAFYGCSGALGLLTFPNTLTKIGNYAFANCSGFIGGLTIPNSVITIGNHAFDNCSGFMGLLTIGESVTTIGDYAFNNCRNFTGSINIPNSVITIGNYAFYGSTAYWGTLTLGNSVTTIGNYAFYGCTGLVGDIVIPNSVTTIGEYAFYDCHSFAGTLTIGNSVNTIGNGAFRNCYNLVGNIVIPNSVTTIGSEAFYNCYGFSSNLSIGNSVTTIGSSAFSYCYNLKGNIEIPNSVTSIGSWAFDNCYGFTGSLTIPNSVTSIGQGAFYYCYGLSEVNYNVTNHADVSDYYPPFQACGGHLNIGNNVVMIPCNMFRYAGFTGTLTIPNSVVTIRDYAFYSCDLLTGTLVIPNSMNTIGVNAFQYCTGLTEVIMGINLMIVGNQAFSNCYGLQKVILPDVVTVIGIEAFRYCNQLAEINMQAPVAPSIGWDVFADNAEGRIITIPCGATANYSEGYWTEWANALVEICGDNEITVLVNPEEAGSATGGGFYDYSQICTLTATGNLGYPFLNWTRNGVVVSTEPVYSFGVTESCTYVANFSPEPVSYDVAVAANMEEAGSVEGAGSYLHGATVTLTATENDGYHFVNWAKNGMVVSTDAVYSFNITEAGNYMANFAPNDYDILVEANPTEGGTVTGAGVYGHNTTATLTATANIGYTFVSWTLDDLVVSSEPTYIFIVTNSGTYVANFELNSYEITAVANPTEGGTVTGAGTYNHFETCTLTATANEGYPFLNWTKNGEVVSEDPTYSFTVTESGSYVANFVETPVSYPITAVANPEAGGTVEGAGSYYYGAMVTLTATPNEHYYFVNWTMNGEEVSDNSSFSFTVTEAGDYVANFALYNFNIELTANPEEGGFVSGGGTFNYGDIATVTATPASGYHFVYWTENNTEVSSDAEYSFTVTEDRSLTANFGLDVYFIAVAPNPIEGGTVSGGGAFNYGGEVVLTAVPNEGYAFVNWVENGEVISTEPTYSFIATSSRNFVVNFELIDFVQTTSFGMGWNWYSTYIEQSGIDGLGQLENSLGNNGLIIKSRSDGFAEYYNINGATGWYGSLGSIHNEQMYMISTNTPCEVSISGYVTNPADHPITINPGWNWMGFPYVQAVNVAVALEGFSPETNDIIKGREGFTTYYTENNANMWYGSLNSFEPGQGYMYKSNSTETKTLTFQNLRGEEVLANITPEGNLFSPRGENFANNMTVMAVVELDDTELRSEEYELAAFVGNECRGSIKLMHVAPINRYIAFLTIFGENEESLRFRLTDGMETAVSDNELSFFADGALGTLVDPYTVRFRGLTGIEDATPASVKVYPNPSNGVYHIEGQGINKIEVYDGLGQLIHSEESCNDFMNLNLRNRANGVYVLHVITKDGVTINRIIKH